MSLLPVRLVPLALAASVLPLSQAFFQGCATFVDGITEHVNVRSQPAGANVFLNGRRVGFTPTTVIVSRWGLHRIRLEMAGYEPVEIPLEKGFNGNADGNVFIGGVWIVVDAMTGAIFRLEVPAKLGPDVHGTELAPGILGPVTLTVSTTLKPEPSARRIGQLVPL